MQTIRRLFLIVPFFIMSICSLSQEQRKINQPLPIVDEITFDSYTLNSGSQGGGVVVLTRIFMLITGSDADDTLLKPLFYQLFKYIK